MIRLLLVYLALFLLPFIIFGGWRWLVKGARGRQALMSDAPVLMLLLLGSLSVFVGLFLIASKERTGIEGRYHPPIYKDGKIRPGYFEKSEQKQP